MIIASLPLDPGTTRPTDRPDPGAQLTPAQVQQMLGPAYQNSAQGVKHDQGKPMYSLVPSGVLAAVVRVLTFGAKKYAPDNWKKIEPDRYYDALWRHVEARRAGEILDPETKEPHYAHAICCLMFMLWFDLNLSR